MSCKWIHWLDIAVWCWLLYDLWLLHKENNGHKETIWKLHDKNMDIESNCIDERLEKERFRRYLSCSYDHSGRFLQENYFCSKCGFTGSEFHRDTYTTREDL